MQKFFRYNGLSIALLAIFLVLWACTLVAGYFSYNGEQEDHHAPKISLWQYATSGQFLEASAENWESEFLEMSMYVWLTSVLFQKGSPESRDPDYQDPDPPITADSPWPARRGGWIKALYARSLTIALGILFFTAFLLHLWGGARAYSHLQQLHGKPPVTMLAFLGHSDFWFQSFQNWQSEMLGIFSMVVLSIFLRQRDSAQSKAVSAPHSSNE